jgi:hypothetical protein
MNDHLPDATKMMTAKWIQATHYDDDQSLIGVSPDALARLLNECDVYRQECDRYRQERNRYRQALEKLADCSWTVRRIACDAMKLDHN